MFILMLHKRKHERLMDMNTYICMDIYMDMNMDMG
jgi:hypothetical protein